uniref:ADP-ribosylation factor-like protein 6 n=1 Tax=Fibrocapsa japonica TaxID=94617 RepID=A0A7S2V202_9STRA|mmetsp:Transcript_2882/g.4238  ORF Transcript_2882/g.4238 Transcript_2882/m.4238 type:complete len:188 (+) Transcript_2882:85-648(+)|eukprot:CAMPEP_0113935844 /NCGR_PEP_ID=MMETSP1339-20121228/2901_1 /TAXON_ID=94617 /ORGANISM="Fibrocapsa japonica" /LENGTH=187 /DNA_ID=CAMNT_0000938127 /DNA_START=80 /DNA_END=643 /DNA_ORIENTATION=- /assembly_acc=CAM_ASM_000762
MGFFKRIANSLGFQKHEVRILIVGLDNSGKTTLINHIKPKKATTFEVTPTVGFQVEEFSKNNLNFTIFDMSGQARYRSLWEHYYRDVQAIMFVLDSTDRIRLCVAKDELETMMAHEDVSSTNIPILFFANKMDLPGAMTPLDCMQELELENVGDKPWHITASNALTGEGVDEGITWLADHLSSKGGK